MPNLTVLDSTGQEVTPFTSLDSLWKEAEFLAHKVEVSSPICTSNYIVQLSLDGYGHIKGAECSEITDAMVSAIKRAKALLAEKG